MKKILSILAVSLISLNFVSCREDNMEIENEVAGATQARPVAENKAVQENIALDSIKVNNEALRETGDPDKDPPKDRTRW